MKTIWTPGAGLPPPWGNIHIYYKNIQRSSLKPLAQSKPNFIGSIYGKGEQNRQANKDKLFELATYHQTREHPYKLFKKRARLNVRGNAFAMRVVDNWNHLPASVVTAPSLNSFKSQLNKYWHGHPTKFEASCYIPGESARYWTHLTKASSQVTE